MSERKITRRHMFRDAFRRAARWLGAAADRRLRQAVARVGLRPPGAVEEVLFVALCTRCRACAEACPFGAIAFADESNGLAHGTPIIEPGVQPCRYCKTFPCAAACPSGALDPARAPRAPMGTVRLDTARCIAWQGGDCRACIDACPRSGQALFRRDGRVMVCRERCVGCGMCEFVCPVDPSAITVKPPNPEAPQGDPDH